MVNLWVELASSQPSLTGKLQYGRDDWEDISGQNKIDSTGLC